MIVEKLQMIATTPMKFMYKLKWLKWLNSNEMAHEFLRFLLGNFNKKKFDAWFIKASS